MNDAKPATGVGLQSRPASNSGQAEPRNPGSQSKTPVRGAGAAHRSQLVSGWIGSLQSLLVTVVIALFIITFLLQAFQIPSPSMENTLLIGDYLLVDKLHFAESGPWGRIVPYSPVQRGDIIVFHYPVNPELHFVKRVIGLPGDRVRIVNRRVLVNGVPLNDKDYAVHRRTDSDYFRDNFPASHEVPHNVEATWWHNLPRHVERGELVVPLGSYFAMGDNRDDSLDSRYWGFVPRANVIGRPLIIYWSLKTPWQGAAAESAPDVKLRRFLYALTHPWEFTRWERTLRLVR